MINHFFFRSIQLYYDAEHHRYYLVIFFAFLLVVGHHGRQNWDEKVIHHTKLNC